MPAPRVGQVVDGYRYLGGDPNAAGAWGPAVMADAPEDQKAIGEARDQANKALGVAMQSGRFMNLNRKNATGPGMGLALGGFWGLPRLGVDDVAKTVKPDYQTMDSLTASQTPAMRPTGSGSTSDYEQRLYRQGFPSIQTQGPANQGINQRLHDQAVHDTARSSFLDTWMQHKGTLLGAEAAFESYWANGGDRFSNTAAPTKAPQGPKVGEVQGGYVFKGGNAADPHSWSPVSK